MKTRTSVAGKRIARPLRVVSITSSSPEAMRGVDQPHALGELHRDLAVRLDVGEVVERVPPHVAVGGGEDDLQARPFLLGHVDRQDRRERHALRDRQDVDDRLAAGVAAAERQPPGLQRVDHPLGGEDEECGMGVRDEEPGDEVLVLGRHALRALAAAPLRAVLGQGRALDVAAGGDGDRHVLALDQVLVVEVGVPVDDLGAARHGEELLHLAQLVGDDRHDPAVRAQDVEVVGDLAARAPRARRSLP